LLAADRRDGLAWAALSVDMAGHPSAERSHEVDQKGLRLRLGDIAVGTFRNTSDWRKTWLGLKDSLRRLPTSTATLNFTVIIVSGSVTSAAETAGAETITAQA
jgi:hypothetical protein